MKNSLELFDLHNHDVDSNEMIKKMPSEKIFQKTSETFQLISDSSRLRILWLLCHCKICVNNIAVAVNMTPPAVSHHLKILKQAGLIENSRIGKEMYYKISNTLESKLLHKSLDDILNIKCPK